MAVSLFLQNPTHEYITTNLRKEERHLPHPIRPQRKEVRYGKQTAATLFAKLELPARTQGHMPACRVLDRQQA